MPTWSADFRTAFRALRRSPGFALVAVLTLAIGIGASAALFSLLDQLFLRALPVAHPERLVVLQTPESPNSGRISMSSEFSIPLSYPMYVDLRDATKDVFDGVLARRPVQLALSARGATELVNGELVSGNYFQVLGVNMALGRALTPEDDRVQNGHPVVVLSYGTWQRRFGGDPSIVGQTVSVNNQPLTVLGVAVQSFQGVELGTVTEVFLPMMEKPLATPLWNDLDQRRSLWLNAMARLKDGVTRERAETVATAVYQRQLRGELEKGFERWTPKGKERFATKTITLLPGGAGRSDLRGNAARLLGLVLAMVGLLLVVACANLANLMAARATRRQREIAIRLAIGAGRGQIVRQFLAESVLIGAAGAALGCVLASLAPQLFLALLPYGAESFHIVAEPRTIAFAALLGLAAGIGFGLLPALESARTDVQTRLRESSAGGGASRSGLRWRRGLVGAQVALSALVLVAAGLLARSLVHILDRDFGFQPHGVLVFDVDPSLNGLSPEAARLLLDRVQQSVERLPGVQAVARTGVRLLNGSVESTSVTIPGYEPPEGRDMGARIDTATPEFFGALGLTMLRGRGIQVGDSDTAARVAVITQAGEKYFFPDQDPLGKHIKMGAKGTEYEIVGVVHDALPTNLREDPPRFIWRPFAQVYDGGDATFYLRVAGDPEALLPAVRNAVRAVDPGLPLVDARALDEEARRSLFLERTAATVSVALGVLAALLAALGVYGVLAYLVSGRVREMGIRAALGATAAELRRLVVVSGVGPAAVGLVCGLLLALPAALLLRTALFGISSSDPLTYGAVAAVLLVAALAAAWIPALRAARVEPSIALRHE
ncbi:MAG: ABC transporter permease [Acidobacteriota bacterium]